MDISANYIFAGIIFGIIGVIFFKEGKKRTSTELYFLGIGLMVFPYFISHDVLIWVVGAALTAIGLKFLSS